MQEQDFENSHNKNAQLPAGEESQSSWSSRKFEIENPFNLVEASIDKVDWKRFDDIVSLNVLTKYEIASLAGISSRTIDNYQRRSKENGNVSFSTLQSELLLLIDDVFNYGVWLFGNATSFKAWLNAPAPALFNKAPLLFLNTFSGTCLVKRELFKIFNGEITL